MVIRETRKIKMDQGQERGGVLERGTAGHRCYKKGTRKMVRALIGERVE